jgi:hypothetical protein
MHYVCIENNLVVSILSYQPSVPETVTVQEISDEQANQIAIDKKIAEEKSGGNQLLISLPMHEMASRP